MPQQSSGPTPNRSAPPKPNLSHRRTTKSAHPTPSLCNKTIQLESLYLVDELNAQTRKGDHYEKKPMLERTTVKTANPPKKGAIQPVISKLDVENTRKATQYRRTQTVKNRSPFRVPFAVKTNDCLGRPVGKRTPPPRRKPPLPRRSPAPGKAPVQERQNTKEPKAGSPFYTQARQVSSKGMSVPVVDGPSYGKSLSTSQTKIRASERSPPSPPEPPCVFMSDDTKVTSSITLPARPHRTRSRILQTSPQGPSLRRKDSFGSPCFSKSRSNVASLDQMTQNSPISVTPWAGAPIRELKVSVPLTSFKADGKNFDHLPESRVTRRLGLQSIVSPAKPSRPVVDKAPITPSRYKKSTSSPLRSSTKPTWHRPTSSPARKVLSIANKWGQIPNLKDCPISVRNKQIELELNGLKAVSALRSCPDPRAGGDRALSLTALGTLELER